MGIMQNTAIFPSVTSTKQPDSSNKVPHPSIPTTSLAHDDKKCSDRVTRVVRRAYRRWAHFVVAHPFKIVAVCFLLTAVCAAKMFKTKTKNNITGYTPYGSRALREFAVQDEFFDQSGHGIRLLLLILPANGSDNLLHTDAMREIVQADDIVQNNLTLFNKLTNRDEPFSKFCNHYCDVSVPVRAFAAAYIDQKEQSLKGHPANPSIQLNYPVSNIFGKEVNLQPQFYGVRLAKVYKPKFGNIDRIESIMIRYRAERLKGWADEDIETYEMLVSQYFEKNYTSKHIRVLTMSASYVQKEIDRSGNILRRYVGLGLAVMIVCSLVTTSLAAFFMNQFSVYRLPVALFACLCPFMAASTALGSLFFVGVRNGSILGVTPFLIIAIGIDDAFLMIHSWQLAMRRKRQNRALACDPRDAKSVDTVVTNQLVEVLEDTGPAVLISALTNITSDLVGMWTGSPEITLLCIGNIAAIAVDFLYQITLFTAVLIICARWELMSELKKRHPQTDTNGAVVAAPIVEHHGGEESSRLGFRKMLSTKFSKLTNCYIKFVSNFFAAAFITLVSAVFLIICLRAALKIEINLTSRKLFPPDSPLLEVDNYREEELMPFYTMAQLYINKPGDLSNATRRHRLDAFIDEMEHLPFAYSSNSSIYFPRTFADYERPLDGMVEVEEDDEADANATATTDQQPFDLNDLDKFLNWYSYFRGMLKYHKTNNGTKTVLDSFMAVVAYHGDEIKQWYQRAVMLQEWRKVVDKYTAEFNITVLHDDGLFLDLLENMPTDIWQSALGTIVCMTIICAVFMNFNLFVVCVTSAVIAAILIETLGIMALMRMTIDPVVMAAVIISMGFSVDIPAHVSYHFHVAKFDENGKRRSIEERIRVAFASVGFPAIQATACTNVCVLTFLVVPVYPAQVFVRVLCTCITLCTLTSLCLLPALFKLLGTLEIFLCTKFRKSHSMDLK